MTWIDWFAVVGMFATAYVALVLILSAWVGWRERQKNRRAPIEHSQSTKAMLDMFRNDEWIAAHLRKPTAEVQRESDKLLHITTPEQYEEAFGRKPDPYFFPPNPPAVYPLFDSQEDYDAAQEAVIDARREAYDRLIRSFTKCNGCGRRTQLIHADGVTCAWCDETDS